MQSSIRHAAAVGLALALASPAAATVGRWSLVLPPEVAACAPIVYDPMRDRLVLPGLGYFDPASHVTERTWARPMNAPAAWAPLGDPASVPAHVLAAAYDSRRDRVLAVTEGGTWALPLAGGVWGLVSESVPAEFYGCWMFAAYDSAGDRLLLADANGFTSDSVRIVTLAVGDPAPVWTSFANTGFTGPVRRYFTCALDDVHRQLLLYGGLQQALGPTYDSDVWRLPLDTGTWSLVPANNGTTPPKRASAVAAYDAAGDRLVLQGGDNSGARTETYAFALGTGTWEQLYGAPPPGYLPPATLRPSLVLDRPHRRLVRFGGDDNNFAHIANNEAWVYDLATSSGWLRFEPGPRHLVWHSAVYDAPRDRVVVFGGWDGTKRHGETWALWLGATPHWELLQPAGTPPSARYLQTAVLDAPNHRMIVYGGYDGSSRNDTWALSLDDPPTWTQLTLGGATPPANVNHVAVYDPDGQRMLAWGGYFMPDVWALDLGASPSWSQLATTGTPTRAVDATAVYDAVGGRMLVFGGIQQFPQAHRTNDVYALAGGVWSKLAPPGTLPAVRSEHAAVLDPLNRRMLAFAGVTDGEHGDLNDCWALPLDSGGAWEPVGASAVGLVPPITAEQPAIFEPSGPSMVVASVPAFRMTLPTPAAVPTPSTGAALALAIAPQPAHGAATVRFALPAAGKVRICVLDLAGRVIATLADGPRAAGAHELRWAPGRGVRAGVYWVRVTAGATTVARRLVLVD